MKVPAPTKGSGTSLLGSLQNPLQGSNIVLNKDIVPAIPSPPFSSAELPHSLQPVGSSASKQQPEEAAAIPVFEGEGFVEV